MNRQQFNEPEFSEARIRYDEAATALSQKCCEYLRSLIREHDIIDFSDCEDVTTEAITPNTPAPCIRLYIKFM